MSPRRTRDLAAALLRKGFGRDNTHHEMYWLYVGGKRTSVRTRISHGAREYGDSLLGQMARQLGLTRSEYDDLIECPMGGTEYVRLLTERGRIGHGP